jgi:hypothetical protein
VQLRKRCCVNRAKWSLRGAKSKIYLSLLENYAHDRAGYPK